MNSPTADASLAAYEDWHRQLGIELECNTPWHQLVKAGLPLVGGVANKRLLEIGCGRGGFSNWLAMCQPPPREVVAADFSPTAVELGAQAERAAGRSGVVWEVQDIQNIRHADGRFDLVLSCETIEHVPDPFRAVSELARVLKPGGWLLLTHPNYLSTMGLYRAYCILRGRGFSEEGQPINQPLRVTQVRRWLRQTGLNPRLAAGRGHYWFWPGHSPADLPVIARLGVLTRWFGAHPLWLAQKPAA